MGVQTSQLHRNNAPEKASIAIAGSHGKRLQKRYVIHGFRPPPTPCGARKSRKQFTSLLQLARIGFVADFED